MADDLVIMFDKIINTSETVPINLKKKKKASCKIENFYIALAVFLITISLLLIVSVCYFYYSVRN